MKRNRYASQSQAAEGAEVSSLLQDILPEQSPYPIAHKRIMGETSPTLRSMDDLRIEADHNIKERKGGYKIKEEGRRTGTGPG